MTLATIGGTCLCAGLALAVYYAVFIRPRPGTPRPKPRRLDPGDGPTVPFPEHPGHPRRFRGGRMYRRTGTGQAQPHHRRPPADPDGGAHRTGS